MKAGVDAIQGGQTTYTNPSGTVGIKEAVSQFVTKTRCFLFLRLLFFTTIYNCFTLVSILISGRGVAVTPAEIVVGPGCKPGLFFACMAIVNEGDEVVLPDPGFPTYTNMVSVSGGKAVMCPLDKEGRCFNMKGLAAALNDKTRLLVVNSPSNPTGGVMTQVHSVHIID